MRETTVSSDDLSIQAAKGKLATLAERPGYADAVKAPPPGSRRSQVGFAVAAVGFVALAFACAGIDSVGLRVILILLFVAATVFCLLAAIGSTPMPAPTIWGAAVVGESSEQRSGDPGPLPRLVLLDAHGVQHEITTNDSIAEVLRVGDVGVAHVRDGQLIKFVRL